MLQRGLAQWVTAALAEPDAIHSNPCNMCAVRITRRGHHFGNKLQLLLRYGIEPSRTGQKQSS